MSGIYYGKKGLMMQTHFNLNNLEAPLVGSNSKNNASIDFFRDVGLDSLIRSFKAEKISLETLENCCISLSDTNMSLLPGTSKMNRDSFEYEMETIIINLLRTIDAFQRIIFIDTNSGNNSITQKVMRDADVLVVNLSQNTSVIDTYFSEYKEIQSQKIFYLFGNYDSNSKYNISNIRRRYKEITNRNSGVIPYNTAYLDAQCDGRVVEFVKKKRRADKEDPNWYFINKAIKSTEKILRLAGVVIE